MGDSHIVSLFSRFSLFQISASTTTSSDTPDTETVIETLPSNVSPLPNDESNSEDFPKVLSAADEKLPGTSSSKVLPSNETNDEQLTSQNYIETSEDCLEDSNSVAHNIDKSYYDDQQNDDYAHELDESLDQITSLDIIDRIEQSLMDQLQKEDSYEVQIIVFLMEWLIYKTLFSKFNGFFSYFFILSGNPCYQN